MLCSVYQMLSTPSAGKQYIYSQSELLLSIGNAVKELSLKLQFSLVVNAAQIDIKT